MAATAKTESAMVDENRLEMVIALAHGMPIALAGAEVLLLLDDVIQACGPQAGAEVVTDQLYHAGFLYGDFVAGTPMKTATAEVIAQRVRDKLEKSRVEVVIEEDPAAADLEDCRARLTHFEELSACERSVTIDADDPNLSDQPSGPIVVPADPPKTARSEFTCTRCQKLFKHNDLMPWHCRRAEDCPVCIPRCQDCRDKEENAARPCPWSGREVDPEMLRRFSTIGCQCGAIYQNIDRFPEHMRKNAS